MHRDRWTLTWFIDSSHFSYWPLYLCSYYHLRYLHRLSGLPLPLILCQVCGQWHPNHFVGWRSDLHLCQRACITNLFFQGQNDCKHLARSDGLEWLGCLDWLGCSAHLNGCSGRTSQQGEPRFQASRFPANRCFLIASDPNRPIAGEKDYSPFQINTLLEFKIYSKINLYLWIGKSSSICLFSTFSHQGTMVTSL